MVRAVACVVALVAVSHAAAFTNNSFIGPITGIDYSQYFPTNILSGGDYTYQGPMPDDFVVQAVGYEQMMSKTYSDLFIKLQGAYHMESSMKHFLTLAMADMVKQNGEAIPGVEVANTPKLDLLAHYELMYANKVFLYQTVFAAAELQNDFFQSRAMQIRILALGDQVPPEITSLVHKALALDFLKMQKISAAFKTVSAFNTWLEDELDVTLDVLEGGAAAKHKPGLMAADLNEARLIAFNAYKDYAGLDLTIFGAELYLQYDTQRLVGGIQGAVAGATGATSFLEVEAATNTQAQSKFYAALFAPYVIGGDMANYLAAYTGYQKYAQFSAATAGLQASQFKAVALKKGGDGTYAKAVKGAWHQFATYQLQAAHIDYITSLWMIYAIFFQSNSAAH